LVSDQIGLLEMDSCGAQSGGVNPEPTADREAKLLAEEDGAPRVTFEHVKRAIHEVLIVSDVPWAEMEKRLQYKKLGRKVPREVPAPEPETDQEALDARQGDISPRLSPVASGGSRMRFPEPVKAAAATPGEALLAPV
jgi:hypothetical protein